MACSAGDDATRLAHPRRAGRPRRRARPQHAADARHDPRGGDHGGPRGAEKLWAGTVVIHPDAQTGAHHHGPVESVIYVVSGRARMRWGERLEFVADAGPGDFIYVPPYVPHQEINAAATSRCPAWSCAAARSRSSSTSTCRASSPTPSAWSGWTTCTTDLPPERARSGGAMRRTLFTAPCGLLLAVPAARAAADGLPVLGVDVGAAGVTVPGVDARMVALPVRGGTLVERIATPTGSVVATRLLRRPLTIPAVAYDATAGGLSADGRTLVLIRPRASFPQRRTSMLVLDARGLHVRARLGCAATSPSTRCRPTAARCFSSTTRRRSDPTRYEVRALDVASRRLRPHAGARPARAGRGDARQPALARRQRRRALGLHALRRAASDAVRARARHDGTHRALHRPAPRCRAIRRPTGVRMAPGDAGVRAMLDGTPRFVVDTRTWAVRRPAARAAAVTPPVPADGGGIEARLVAALALGAAGSG